MTYTIRRQGFGVSFPPYDDPLEIVPADPGYAYCPNCNTLGDWQTGYPDCPPTGLCKGRGLIPIPTTLPRR